VLDGLAQRAPAVGGARGGAVLREAVANGFKNVGYLKREEAFAPVRARDDFQKLVAEMGAKAKGAP
jgi:hypothetical protein